MSQYEPINSVNMQAGLDVSAAPLSPESTNTLADGSYNAIISGNGFVKPWSGATSQGSGTGSEKMMPFGNTWGGIKSYHYIDNTFLTNTISSNEVTTATNHGYVTGAIAQVSTAGTLPTGLAALTDYYLIVTAVNKLKFASTLANALLGTAIAISNAVDSTVTIDVSNSTVTASGNFMQDIGLSRWGIGAGQPMITGVPVPGYTLSSNLQVQIPASGVFGPPVQAGLSQPSAPGIGIINTVGNVSNPVSAKISRSRPSTGAISVASPMSAVVTPQANRIRLTFPAASVGQTHWRAFFTFQGFGGVGVAYLITYNGSADIAESTIAAGSAAGTAATGALVCVINPSIGETVNINGKVFTFIAGASTTTDVHIGATGDATMANLAAVLNASAFTEINVATYTLDGYVMYITYDTVGTTGNTFTLNNSSGGNVATATPTLTGGTEPVGRSLEFNYQDGDLLPIEASYDDYPPPAATNAIRLNTVMCLPGCYADTANPTGSNTGTAIAVSKENNYESYVPTSLLYLPEQVVDVQARPTDDYGYIGCQNSIHALQYVGYRGDELPSCTITTILPDIGIQYHHNWCHFRGQLLIYTAQGNLILMDETGSFDTSFANPVTKILKSFTTASTALGYDPLNDSIVVMSGSQMLVFSMQIRQWRQIWLPDFASTSAIGSYTFGVNPSDGETILFNGTTFTFVNTLSGGNEIEIQGTLPLTLSVAASTLNASVVSGVALATYSQNGVDTLYIAYDTAGTAGNAYTLGTNTGNIVRSAATLSGGMNGIDGTFTPSCTAAARKLYFSLTNGGIETAYTYDTGSATAPLSFTCNYQNSGGVVVSDLYEMAVAAQTSVSTDLAVAVNRNLTKTTFRQMSSVVGSDAVTDATNSCTQNMIGKKFILFGAGVGGPGTYYVRGTILAVPTVGTVQLSVMIPIAVSGAQMFIGNYTGVKAITDPTHLPNFTPNMPELRSYQIAVWFQATGMMGNVLTVDLIGTRYASSRAI